MHRRPELTSGHDCCSETQARHEAELAVQLLLVAQVLEYSRIVLVCLLIGGYLGALAIVHFVLVHPAEVRGLAPEESKKRRQAKQDRGQGKMME